MLRISQELDRAYPKGLDVRAKAKLVIQIFENVNSKPPGWLGTLTLGGVYLASLATVVIGGALFVVSQNADLGQFIFDAAFGPRTEVNTNEIIRVPDTRNANDFYANKSLVVTFADRESAESALDQLRGELGPEGPVLLYGDTIILPLDANAAQEKQDEWFDRYEAAELPVVVNSADGPASLQLMCVAPTAEVSEQIQADASSFFSLPADLRPIPPWHQVIELTAEQKRARQTIQKLQQSEWMYDLEADADIYDQINVATRRGENEKVEQLQQQIQQSQQQRHQIFLDELRQSPEDEIDGEILDRYKQALASHIKSIEEADDENPIYYLNLPRVSEWIGDLSARLGQLPDDEPGSRGIAVAYGSVDMNGLILNIYVSLDSPASGVLAITEWLEQQECQSFKYSINGGFGDF